jgi:hypothetical protein
MLLHICICICIKYVDNDPLLTYGVFSNKQQAFLWVLTVLSLSSTCSFIRTNCELSNPPAPPYGQYISELIRPNIAHKYNSTGEIAHKYNSTGEIAHKYNSTGEIVIDLGYFNFQ